jgi:hypothetical protein
MATKRIRTGRWHYVIKRQGLLLRPIYLSFDSEAEGDEYTRRVEALLDRGVVPDEFNNAPKKKHALRDSVKRYVDAHHVSEEDKERLRVVLMRLPREQSMNDMTFAWAQEWVSQIKREYNLAPGTIRKHVGALARVLDWLAAQGETPFNPLRLLAKGYATYGIFAPHEMQLRAVGGNMDIFHDNAGKLRNACQLDLGSEMASPF